MSEYQKESLTLQLFNYLKHNPGTTISLAYVLLTLCGVYYSITFFAQFNIPILKLADVSDLLIVGIGEPAAMFMFCGGILVAVFTDFLVQRSFDSQKRWRQMPASFKRTLMLIIVYVPKFKSTVVIYIGSAFLVYSFMFVYGYAEWQGQQVKAGHGHRVTLTGESVESDKPLILLGSTTNFVVVFDVDEQQASVYPVESLTRLQPFIDDVEHDAPNQTDAIPPETNTSAPAEEPID